MACLTGLVALVLILVVGCVGPETMGDRAMERGDSSEALSHYERAIERNEDDPDLYYRAAEAAQQQGAFAKAERYFSRSLRYGGGVEVAETLAEFYIQTGNYAQAVRVLQYLARIETNEEAIQPLYSDLGTAMMYAGQHLDAESYLLLAQELEPGDPVPYINLGVLYDRHLRNKPKAKRFYECFTELARDRNQVRQVRNRLREIETRRPVDTSRVQLECGEPYRPTPSEDHDLEALFGIDTSEVVEAGDESGEVPFVIERLNLDTPIDYEPSEESRETALDELTDSQSDDSELEPLDETDSPVEPLGGETSTLTEESEEAYQAGRYDEAVELFEELDDERGLDRRERRRLGESYYRTGRHEEAARRLEAVVDEEPTPSVVVRLVEVYDRLDESERKDELCKRFADWPDYEDELEICEYRE